MKHVYCWLLAVLLFFSGSAAALRCGRDLVELGDYKDDVYAICGEPESVTTHTEIRGNRNYAEGSQYFGNGARYPNSAIGYGQDNFRQVEIMVEEWIYNFGRSRLKQYLRFENGQLKEVRDLGRGR